MNFILSKNIFDFGMQIKALLLARKIEILRIKLVIFIHQNMHVTILIMNNSSVFLKWKI